jgi:hypothetical protein
MFQRMMLEPYVSLDGSVELLTRPKDLNTRLMRYGACLQQLDSQARLRPSRGENPGKET